MKRLRAAAVTAAVILLCLLPSCSKSYDGETETGGTDPYEPMSEEFSESDLTYEPNAALLLSSDADGLSESETVLAASFDSFVADAGGEAILCEKKFGVSADNIYSARKAFDASLKNGCTAFFVSKPLGKTASSIACEYPDAAFFVNSSERFQDENIYTYNIKTYEGFYLAGIAAAESSKTDRIAFIAERTDGRDDNEVTAMANAFALGAKAANENISVFVKSTSANMSAVRCIYYLSSAGCDIFAGNISAEESIAETNRLGRYLITFNGGDTDGQSNIIGSVNEDYSLFFTAICKKAESNSPVYYDYLGGITDSAVSFTLVGEDEDGLTAKRLAGAEKALKSGEFSIFSGYKLSFSETADAVITPSALTSGDRIVLPAGQFSPRGEITEKMDYYVDELTER